MLPAVAFVLYSLLVQDSVAVRVHAPTSGPVGEPVRTDPPEGLTTRPVPLQILAVHAE
jgi:hypothetical protein